MLSNETIQIIADTLKVDVKTLTTAINSQDEAKIEIPKLNTFLDEELNTLKENIKKDGYSEGKTAGVEMTARKVKEISGVDIEGKDLKKIYEAAKKKIEEDAKIEPNDKVKDLESTITKLQSNITDLETERDSVASDFNSFKLETTLLSKIPENSVSLAKRTVFADMQANGYTVKEENGKHLVLKNGEVMKDSKLQNPITFEAFSESYLVEKNWLKKDKTGRSGKDEVGDSPVNYDQFVEQCKADGINPAGADGQARARELAEKNPEFYN